MRRNAGLASAASFAGARKLGNLSTSPRGSGDSRARAAGERGRSSGHLCFGHLASGAD